MCGLSIILCNFRTRWSVYQRHQRIQGLLQGPGQDSRNTWWCRLAPHRRHWTVAPCKCVFIKGVKIKLCHRFDSMHLCFMCIWVPYFSVFIISIALDLSFDVYYCTCLICHLNNHQIVSIKPVKACLMTTSLMTFLHMTSTFINTLFLTVVPVRPIIC